MKNIIFVDLDETLIHTFMPMWLDEKLAKDAVEVFLPGDSVPYKVSLRLGAKVFLERLRGLGDVYMLTAAVHDYAVAMNKHFELGFADNQIYAREDVRAGDANPDLFNDGKVYLFDNLPRRENRSKIEFLRPLGEVIYVQVPEFYSNEYSPLTTEQIDYLVGRIG